MTETRAATDLVAYTLRLGDDALILSQRLGEWIAASPQLEQDVAIGNIALDLLGQARALLTYAGELEGRGRTEDDLAFFRDERCFTNTHLVEVADHGDFAIAMARLLLFASYQLELYRRLTGSADERLAAVAAKAVKEVTYHRDHATQWVLRLGDGSAQSHRRMQAGLDTVWPYLAELFDSDDLVTRLRAAVDPAELEQPVLDYLRPVLEQATLRLPDVAPAVAGGRRGVHSEAMGYLLAEMQHLARSHPGARW